MTENRTMWTLNYIAIACMMTASAAGIFDPQVYVRESATWGAQGMGQDFVNLFLIAPAMLVLSHFAMKGSKAAYITWFGFMVYVLYSYILYCFAMHFNRYFLVYCGALGTSFYAFALAFKNTEYNVIKASFKSGKYRAIPGFLMLLAIVFALLWLKEIIPSIIDNTVPRSITDAGLMINPVHINDLAFVLPAFIVSGVMLIRQKAEGYTFVPAMFAFSVAMDLALCGMMINMNVKGVSSDPEIAVIFGAFTVISAVLLCVMLSKIKKIPQENHGMNVI